MTAVLYRCIDNITDMMQTTTVACSNETCTSQNTVAFIPKTYDKLLWVPGYKLALDLPDCVKMKRQAALNQTMRLSINVKSDRKGEAGNEKSIHFVIIVPTVNGTMHRSIYRIYVSGKKDAELMMASNFDVPIPSTDYFFVTCEGEDISNIANIKGELTITSI